MALQTTLPEFYQMVPSIHQSPEIEEFLNRMQIYKGFGQLMREELKLNNPSSLGKPARLHRMLQGLDYSLLRLPFLSLLAQAGRNSWHKFRLRLLYPYL